MRSTHSLSLFLSLAFLFCPAHSAHTSTPRHKFTLADGSAEEKGKKSAVCAWKMKYSLGARERKLVCVSNHRPPERFLSKTLLLHLPVSPRKIWIIVYQAGIYGHVRETKGDAPFDRQTRHMRCQRWRQHTFPFYFCKAVYTINNTRYKQEECEDQKWLSLVF